MKQKHQPHEIVVQIQAQDKENEGNGHEEQNDIDEENEVMEEWKQIYDVLDNIGEVFDVEEKDKVDAFTEKLGRMHNVIKKKADIINKTKKSELKLVEKVAILEAAKAKLAEKVDAMEASGSSCRECTLKDEVILNKEALANRKEKEAAEAKKQLGSQRKLVKNMKNNYEKAIDENNELKTTIDENKEYIKQLEEQCQTSDEGEDEVEEVEVARNPMNKNQSGHLCLTCNQRFVTNNGLEKHIQDKHTELWCDYCGDMFRNKSELDKHMEQCGELGMEAVECDKCSKKLVRWGSRKHKCQPQKKAISCTVCDMIFKTVDDVKRHAADEHRSNKDKSKIVCRHYKNGNCYKGDRCDYAHVGFVTNNSQEKHNSVNTKKASMCRHGDSCSWLARGVCGFFHRGVGVQKPHRNASQQKQQETGQPRPTQQQVRPRPTQQPQSVYRRQEQRSKDDTSCPNGPTCIHLARGSCSYGGVFYHVRHKQQQQGMEETRLCWEDANCTRIACRFTHLSLQDFPNLPQPRMPQVMRKQNQGRTWN